VLEVRHAILKAGATGAAAKVGSLVEQPAALSEMDAARLRIG
jgi:hypothetical protein